MSYGRGDPYRASGGSVDLTYRDGPPSGGRGGSRRYEEDTDRYESYRGGGERFEEDRETDRVEYSNGRSGGGRPHRGSNVNQRDIEVDISRERERDGRPRRPQYYEEDRYERESSSPTRSTISSPYGGGGGRDRRESIVIERDRRGPPPIRGPARPGYLRRQSSLDTFDRRPRPRYDEDHEEIDIHASIGPGPGPRREEYPPRREDFRPPTNVPIPLPPMRRPLPRYEERDYEEIRIAEPEYYGDESYHRRGGPRGGRQRSGSRVEASINIEERETERRFPRRGKTKMPRRLIDPRAAIQLGYPFEEEVSSYIMAKLASSC
jgi:hypothetical protein